MPCSDFAFLEKRNFTVFQFCESLTSNLQFDKCIKNLKITLRVKFQIFEKYKKLKLEVTLKPEMKMVFPKTFSNQKNKR